MKLVLCGIGILATSATLLAAQPFRKHQPPPPVRQLKPTVPVRNYWDPPPRVDPLPERALRLRVIDAPSVIPYIEVKK